MSGSVLSITDGCKIINGELILTRSLSEDRIQMLSQKLYNALVNYEVPHWRVIGCSVRDNGRTVESVLNKIGGINMSYIELMNALSKIVLSERHGNFYAPDFDNVQSVVFNAQTNNGLDFAHVMICDQRGKVTTSNGVRFYGETATPVKCLALNEDICDVVGKNVEIFAYLAFGKGIVDFSDNNRIFKKCSSIVPCRTVYDLTDTVMVRPYRLGDKNVKFTYFKDVDENVLAEILQGLDITA